MATGNLLGRLASRAVVSSRSRRALLARAAALLAAPACAHAQVFEAAPALRRSTVKPRIPSVTLVRDDLRQVSLAAEVDSAAAVLLNFVFLGCTTVCPLASRVFAQTQAELLAQHAEVRLLSISIDPLSDSPARLAAHAREVGRAAGWSFYTGSVADSEAVQRAFGVWRPDRMEHPAATFVRSARGGVWTRLDGFASPQALLAELGAVRAAPKSIVLEQRGGAT